MKRLFTLLLLGIGLLYSCTDQKSDTGRIQIIEALNQQQEAWNNGDIDGFMQGYWNNDSLMFVSGDHVSYGWQKVHDNYKAKYSSKELMGELSFEIIKLDQLSNDSYIMIGSWKLDRYISEVHNEIGGKFSLLWRQINGNWVVVVDHTS